jgi:multidrug efflux pump subunit AcrB
MTLGGLALAVGVLVDDATVTIENIHHQMEQGKGLEQAILDGAHEIALPALVSTLCICIVFVPMFFLTGVGKYLFVPLAEAVVFAMLASYFLSRTLVPTLVMWFYRNFNYYEARHSGAARKSFFARVQDRFEGGFDKFRNGYRSVLATLLEHRLAFGSLFLILFLGSWAIAPFLGQDFFPNVDAGQFRLHFRARSGTRLEESAQLADRIEAVIRREVPREDLGGMLDNIGIPNSGISLSYSNSGLIGPGDGDILVSLKEGHKPTDSYVRKLRRTLGREFPGTMFYFLPADIVSQTLNFGIPAPLNVQVVGRDQESNRQVAARLAEKMRKIEGAVDVRVQQPADMPKLQFAVDRTKAARMGLSEKDVASSVLMSLTGNGQVAPVYWLNPGPGIQYLINVRAPEMALGSINALYSLPVTANHPGRADGQVLANLATMKRTASAPIYTHRDAVPVIDVFGGVSGRDLGAVLREVRKLMKEMTPSLPRGSHFILRGQAETMDSSYLGLGIGLIAAIVLIYFVLVINFQSWLDPFIIITALPGALAGVIWGLFLSYTTLSVPALMGAIMSLGVATANSVLVVSFARTNLSSGMEPIRAALEAGVGRLRPVLMTALAMIIGMLPMSLGVGEGAEQNAPLARAVIGGLMFATFATLLFVPLVFSFFHHRRLVAETLDNSVSNAS